MYRIRNTVYADAGKILKGPGKVGYKFIGKPEEFTEVPIDLETIKFSGAYAIVNDELMMYVGESDYPELKASIVKAQFSNDDQMALLLNKESSLEDATNYERMQSWRGWARILARRILFLCGRGDEIR